MVKEFNVEELKKFLLMKTFLKIFPNIIIKSLTLGGWFINEIVMNFVFFNTEYIFLVE